MALHPSNKNDVNDYIEEISFEILIIHRANKTELKMVGETIFEKKVVSVNTMVTQYFL